MRVYELAKQLDVTSKALVSFIREKVGIEVKSHMSNLSDDQVDLIKSKLPSKKAKQKEEAPKKKEKKERKSPQKKKAKESPKPVKEEKEQENQEPKPPKDIPLREIEVELPVGVRQIAQKLGVKVQQVLDYAVKKRLNININSSLSEEQATVIAEGFNAILIKPLPKDKAVIKMHEDMEKQDLEPRHPVITLMGHVDHGKTSLLDRIRKSNVTDKEFGGITQHIGAYVVNLPNGGKLTFLDTPGHEAFTAMRARGAHSTDIVILVVAADDGVMPQTIEAINHAKAAEVPIVVAINKMDTKGADPDKVKRQLMEQGIMPEEWGGKTVMVPVSAKTGEGIDDLLEMVSLEAELLELKANKKKPASGIVIEAEVHPFKGVLCTFLVKSGTLKVGDALIVGDTFGKVKSIINEYGARLKSLGPSEAGQALGINNAPEAGDAFYVVSSEKEARAISEFVRQRKKEESEKDNVREAVSLDNLFEKMQEGDVEELRVILKADVRGSLEAVKASLEKISTSDAKINIMHAGIGEISYSDVLLADSSKAVIIGFNVSANSKAKKYAQTKSIEIKIYKIIYDLIDQVKAALEGMLEPIIQEVWVGTAEVLQVFNLSKSGTIAGCQVRKGKITRGDKAKLVRNGDVVYQGRITSLKRFKDDARDVAEGYECGIGIGYSKIMPGDEIQCFQEEKILRKLK